MPIINIIAEQFIDQHNKDNFLFTDEIVDRTYKEILKDLEINMLEEKLFYKERVLKFKNRFEDVSEIYSYNTALMELVIQ